MFKYFFLTSVRVKSSTFWTLVFPIVLMTCFHFAFGNVYSVENSCDASRVIVSENTSGAYADAFDSLIDSLSEQENGVIERVYADTPEEAREMLLSDEADIVFTVEDDSVGVLLNENYSVSEGMIGKTVAETFMTDYKVVGDAYASAPQTAEKIIADLNDPVVFTGLKSMTSGEQPNVYNWYYYSTLIMAIMFNAMSGIANVALLQADVTGFGMRNAVSPQKKWRMIAAAFCSKLVLCFAVSLILLLLIGTVFGIPLGSRIWLIIATVFICNVFAISLGQLFGLYIRGSLAARENKAMGIIMLSVFLSGEMVAQLPGILEKYCPIINDINPATVMNMTIYRSVYYDDPGDLYVNLIKIAAASLVFLIFSTIKLRRDRYASV